jgi:cysteine desulfurase
MGGGQEQNYRSGTENLPGIVGFGAAVAGQDFVADAKAMSLLRDKAKELLSAVEGVKLLGKGDAPHIISLSVPGLRSQGIINCLQDKGVYVSAVSACSRGHRSHVLEAMGLDAVPLACAAGWVLMTVWEVGLMIKWRKQGHD